MREVHLSAEAEDDLSSALEWYGARGKTLEFLREIERAIEAIEDNFEQFPVVHKTARRALVKHFPYSIFFVDRGETLEVVSIFHQSRNPALWQGRIE